MPDVTSDQPPFGNGPDELLKQLNAQPVSEILGVVDPLCSGVVGSSDGNDRWTFSVTFAAWKLAGEPARTRKLTLRKPGILLDECGFLSDLFKPYEVLRFRARLAEQSVFGGPEALLVEAIGTHSDDHELNRMAQQLQEPVTFETLEFGRFTLDRRIDWFVAETTWGSVPMELHLRSCESADQRELLNLARSLWEMQPAWDERIKNFAVAKLLDLKNEGWLQDDEKQLTPEAFKQRMTLESITIYSHGHFEFWFDDGDLFWGHSIMVEANLTEGPKDAGIHG